MAYRKTDTCIFCDLTKVLSKEHILSKWMRPHLPDTEVPQREAKLWRRDGAMGQPLPLHVKPPRLGSGEHRSQTLRVVCVECNNGWMKKIVDGSKPAIKPLLLGRWEDLSEEVQRNIATWFALHNIVYEQSWEYLQITPLAERQKFMADHDPGPRRFIWIARTVDDSAIAAFARVMGSGAEPSLSSQTTLLIAAAVGKLSLLSIYDPAHSVGEEKMQKIQELLDPWALRIWPPTVNAQPPGSPIPAGLLHMLLREIQRIIDGGESKLARAQ